VSEWDKYLWLADVYQLLRNETEEGAVGVELNSREPAVEAEWKHRYSIPAK
jgi:hypothetical protein